MAVAPDAVGPSSSGAGNLGATSLSWTHTAVGSGVALLVGCSVGVGSSDSGFSVTATCDGNAMTPLTGIIHANAGTVGFIRLFGVANQASGAHSIVVTASGGTPTSLSGGSESFTGADTVSPFGTPVTATGSGTSASATVTGTISGNQVFALVGDGSGAAAGWGSTATSRWANNVSGGSGCGCTEGATTAAGGSVTVTDTISSDFWAIAAVEVKAAAAAAPPVPPARPGQTWLRRFRRRVTPAAPPPATGPVAGAAGLSGSGSLAAAGTVTAPASLSGSGSLSAATAVYIAGLGGSGAGYFKDSTGAPRMVLGDAAWGLCGNAGRWNSGNWQGDFDGFLANRASQGFTVIYTKPMGTAQSGNIDNNGGQYDGTMPFSGGAGANPSTGLNSAFWSRIDYFLASALNKGITVFLNAIGYASDFDSGPGPLAGKSTTEFQAYGAALGGRYAGQGNLIWMVADDYFGSADAKISAFLTGLRAAGDTHPIAIENYPESTSRQDLPAGTALSWGTSNAQFNFVYSYNATYYGVEKAYLESSPLTVIWGDGYFYQGGNSGSYQGGTGAFAYDHAVRQDAWHAVSSGARGWVNGSEGIWQYQSNALADSALEWWYVHGAGKIRQYVEGLTGWQNLVPDTSSALVTGGRGTHASSLSSGGGGGQYEVAFTDSYVTASRTPDSGSGSSLAVIYLSHGTTITIDQTKMASGYTATWVDPLTTATSSATTGSTYNSTAKGSNSAGEADWVLVLQAPPVTSGAAGLSGSGSLTAAAAVTAPASLSGSGSLSAAATVTAPAALSGSGALSAAAQVTAPASLSGSGSLAAAPAVTAPAGLSGAGALASAATVTAPAGLSGSGTLGSAATATASAALAGSGTLAAAAVLPGAASLSGSGSLAAAALVTVPGTAGLSGSGALSAAVTIAAPAGLSGSGAASVPSVAVTAPAGLNGSGALSAGITVSSAAALSGSGTATAAAAVTAGASLSGSGTVSASPSGTTPGAAALDGSGSLSATAPVTAPAVLSGSGSLVAATAVTSPAALSGSGALAAAVTVTPAAVLAGSGALAATVTVTAQVTLSGTGSLSASAAGNVTGTASLSGTGTLAAAASTAAGAALSGTGSLTAAAAVTAQAALSGSGSLTAAGAVTTTALLAGSGSMTVPAVIAAPASLSGSGSLSASPAGSTSGAAALSGSGALAAAGTAAAGAPLSGSGTLSAAALPAVPGAAALAGSGTLAAAVTVTVTAPASLSGSGSLTAAAVLAFSAAVPLAGAGTLTVTARVIIPVTEPAVTWTAQPAALRWGAAPLAPRWLAVPSALRWRIAMAQFPPIAAISLEEVNATWTADLDGTAVDPTGQSQGQPALPVYFAFPQTSGDYARPAQPSAWYAGTWLLGGTGRGFVAQALVGPGGGVVTLTAGLAYDVFCKITGTPESPVKFVGVLPVY